MSKNKFDCKVAKKIISDYTEKINYYKAENQALKKQVTDLKVTLGINRELLENHMKDSKKDNNNTIAVLINEKEELKKAIKTLQIEYSNKFISTKTEIEKIKVEKFELENMIIGKDNKILLLETNTNNNSNLQQHIVLSPTKALVEISNKLIKSQETIINLEAMLNEEKQLNNKKKNANDVLHDSNHHLTNESFSSNEKQSTKILQFLPNEYYELSAHTADLNTEFDNLESSLNNSAKNKSMNAEYLHQDNDQLDNQLKTAKEIIASSEEKIHKYKKNINTLKSKNRFLTEKNTHLEKELLRLNQTNTNHYQNRYINISVDSSIGKCQDNSICINQNFSSLMKYLTDEYYENDVSIEQNEEANKTIISSVS